MEFSSLGIDRGIQILLELIGGPQYRAQMAGAAAETKSLGASTKVAGAEMSLAAKRTWTMNQALYTLRRYTFYATLALTAVGGTLVKWGYNYYTTVTQANIAFTQLLHSASKAQTYVQRLYTVAAETPFSFQDVTTAARRFISLGGLDPNMAIRTIKDVGNALSAAGNISSSAISRANLQLATMLSLGRVTGQVALNLERDHISIYRALAAYFNTSILNVRNGIRRGSISSQQALEALHQYIQKNFGGAAQKQTFGTLAGVFTTFRDYISKLMYTFESHAFVGLQKGMLGLVNTIKGANAAAAATGGSWRSALDYLDRAGHFYGALSAVVGLTIKALHAFWEILTKSVIPAVVITLVVLRPVLATIGWFLDRLAAHTTILRIVILPVIAAWIFWHGVLLTVVGPIKLVTTALKILMGAQIKQAITTALAGLAEKRAAIYRALMFLWTNKLRSATALLGLAFKQTTVAEQVLTYNEARGGVVRDTLTTKTWLYQTRLAKLVRFIKFFVIDAFVGLRVRILALGTAIRNFSVASMMASLKNMVIFIRTGLIPTIIDIGIALRTASLALLTTPIGLILLGLTVLFTTLYFKWKSFRDTVNQTFGDWNVKFEALKTTLKGIWDILNFRLPGHSWLNAVSKLLLGTEHPIAAFQQSPAKKYLFPGSHKHWYDYLIPHFAGGGFGPAGTAAIVGEHGPELVQFGQPSTVTPISRLPDVKPFMFGSTSGGGVSPTQPIIIQLILDRKVLAEAVAHANADAKALR